VLLRDRVCLRNICINTLHKGDNNNNNNNNKDKTAILGTAHTYCGKCRCKSTEHIARTDNNIKMDLKEVRWKEPKANSSGS
jgi:hypothetical protein